MLIRWIGAALLVGACSAVGLGQSRRLRERVRYLNTCLMRLERMKTEVCCLYTPLPSALELLCGAKIGEGHQLDALNIFIAVGVHGSHKAATNKTYL